MFGGEKPASCQLVVDCRVSKTYIGVPSCGLRKRTPSSVTFASFNKETIWKLKQDQISIHI